jgi:hypothetical protein
MESRLYSMRGMVILPRRLALAALVPFLFLLPTACGGAPSAEGGQKPPAPTPAAQTPPAPTPAAQTPAPAPAPSAPKPAKSMDAAIAELMAKPEQSDDSITVQHVLIAFQGAPRITGVSRSKDEAKVLAEKVWQEAIGGADFKALMKQHSNDSGGGEYPMTKAGRAGMVAGFGNVGFRLKVGEIGVAPWDAQASPYGWHIIKRVK